MFAKLNSAVAADSGLKYSIAQSAQLQCEVCHADDKYKSDEQKSCDHGFPPRSEVINCRTRNDALYALVSQFEQCVDRVFAGNSPQRFFLAFALSGCIRRSTN